MNRDGTRHFRSYLLGVASLAAAIAMPLMPTSGLAQEKTEISVGYCETYCFDTAELAQIWWNGIKEQYEAKYPDRILRLVPIGGGYDDIINKLSLLYRTPSTTPDVAQLPGTAIGQWVASDYLLPMDDYLATAAWWPDFAQVVKDEGTFDGKVYAVNMGENVSMLYYNREMFKQAGLPEPWNPQNWDDILVAARQIKEKVPGVAPLWLMAGTSTGSVGVLMGSGNLLYGSSNPTIFDDATGKWVVDSSGLREVFAFYKAVYGEGLGAPLSDVFSPSAVTIPVTDTMPNGKVAIVLGSNFYGGQWGKVVCAPCWDKAAEIEGVAAIPYSKGQAPNITTTIGGWDYAIAASTAHPQEAWDLVDLMESEQNSIDATNWAGWVPPNTIYGMKPAALDFGPPSNEMAAKVLPYGKILPPLADFETWSKGLQSATGALAQNPDTTSVDDAIGILKDYVTNQLGEDLVETLN